MGRQAHSNFFGLQPLSASATCVGGQTHVNDFQKVDYEVARPMETAEGATVVEEYRQAAANAKAAGFDGVELHAANGYLLDQFLQSSTNLRDDKYGGSFENRFRLTREALEAVFTVWPANRVGVRLAPNGAFGSMGSADNFEMFSYVLTQLNKMGLAYVHVMDGLAFGFHGMGRVMKLFDVKSLFDGPVMGNCGYTPLVAEGAIGTGAADMIAFGRLYLSNPDLVERLTNDQYERVCLCAIGSSQQECQRRCLFIFVTEETMRC
jgi:N-ethylmaleimide reductase